jgi:hypothetical protein
VQNRLKADLPTELERRWSGISPENRRLVVSDDLLLKMDSADLARGVMAPFETVQPDWLFDRSLDVRAIPREADLSVSPDTGAVPRPMRDATPMAHQDQLDAQSGQRLPLADRRGPVIKS